MGLMIVAVGVYTLFVSLWLGAFILAFGAFTVYEGVSGGRFCGRSGGHRLSPDHLRLPVSVDDLLSDFSYYGDDK